MVRTPSNSLMTDVTDAIGGVGTNFSTFQRLQWVSEVALKAQTITGTWDVALMEYITTTGATYVNWHGRVVDSGGSLVGTLFNYTGATVLVANPISPLAFQSQMDGGTVSSVSCGRGDYLVLEAGVYIDNESTKTMHYRPGDDTFESDITAETTTERKGWFELSHDIKWVDQGYDYIVESEGLKIELGIE